MVKDYDCEILYHPGKVNVVADALSRKSVRTSVEVARMRLSMDSPLVGLIREARTEGFLEENWKIERIRGEITRFMADSH